MRSCRNSTPGFASSRYCSCTAAASALPKRMSSFENPNVNESFWSISVTRTSSASESESRLASSNPPNPAPRITTCFTRGSQQRALSSAEVGRGFGEGRDRPDADVLGVEELEPLGERACREDRPRARPRAFPGRRRTGAPPARAGRAARVRRRKKAGSSAATVTIPAVRGLVDAVAGEARR